jgi:U11/U12 small nuclear ribonucleoprotein 65 kDa protein
MNSCPLSSMESSNQGFGRIDPIPSAISTMDTTEQRQVLHVPLPLVPLEDIIKHRLSDEQLHLYDNGRLYKNYQRGAPSQRLYIKNLNNKHVDERILHSIYDRYSDESFPIDIRLLRDGKMKGQAFISLPNEDIALRALNDTNGYVLYEKPMIVQFARSAKPKDNV